MDYAGFIKKKTITEERFAQKYELINLMQASKGQEHHEIYDARHRRTGARVCIKKINLTKLSRRSPLIKSL